MEDKNSSVTSNKIEEYTSLRQEVIHALQYRVWGVASYSVFAGAIFGLNIVYEHEYSYTYMITLALTAPFIIFSAYLERIRLRINTYVRVFLETGTNGLGYQTRLEIWRKKLKRNSKWYRFLDRPRYVISLIGVYIIVGCFCSALLLISDIPAWEKGVSIVLFILMVISCWYFISVLMSKRKFLQYWRQIQQRERTVNRE